MPSRPVLAQNLALASLLLCACNAGPTTSAAVDGPAVTDAATAAADLAMADLAGSAADGSPMGELKQLTVGPFPVAAGAEVFKCQTFANPFGADADITGYDSHMGPGAHHLVVFLRGGVGDGPLEDCSENEFYPNGVFGAQGLDVALSYPPGVASPIPHDQGLEVVVHYLNAGPKAITGEGRLTLHRAAPGTVTSRAGEFFFSYPNLSIPPDPNPQTVSHSCTAGADMTILFAASNLFKHGVSLTAAVGGTTVYESRSWIDVPYKSFQPPLVLKAGQKLDISCVYLNDTGYKLVGNALDTGASCLLLGQYYPSQGPQLLPCL